MSARLKPLLMSLDAVQSGAQGMSKKSRLILEAKPDERFILFDEVSGLSTRIKVFFRNNGNLAIAFEAPSAIRISREQQRSVGNDNRKTD